MLTSIATNNPTCEQPAEQTGKPSVACIRPKDWSGEHKTYNLLADDNWQSWWDDIMLTFGVCGLDDYVYGILKCPDTSSDPVAVDNWKYNDMYTQKIIRDRLSTGQKFHTANCDTAYEMWSNLQAIHQSCGDQTENQLMCELTEMKVKDGDNIIKHLAKIKQLWDRITLVCTDDLSLTPKLFKKFLAYSLPPLWDEFTRQYRQDPDKRGINIHHFIGECNEEYC